MVIFRGQRKTELRLCLDDSVGVSDRKNNKKIIRGYLHLLKIKSHLKQNGMNFSIYTLDIFSKDIIKI
jgi:hypothetical protein